MTNFSEGALGRHQYRIGKTVCQPSSQLTGIELARAVSFKVFDESLNYVHLRLLTMCTVNLIREHTGIMYSRPVYALR
jgi:hypothetical protein